MKRRIAVRAIIYDKNKLFCVRHKAYGSKAERLFWCTPGGGIEEGEDLVGALKREIMEEIGVLPIVGDLLYVQQYMDEEDKNEHIEFFFNVTNVNDFYKAPVQKASMAHIEIEEFAFIDKKDYLVKPIFLKTEDIYKHITSKRPTKIFTYK